MAACCPHCNFSLSSTLDHTCYCLSSVTESASPQTRFQHRLLHLLILSFLPLLLLLLILPLLNCLPMLYLPIPQLTLSSVLPSRSLSPPFPSLWAHSVSLLAIRLLHSMFPITIPSIHISCSVFNCSLMFSFPFQFLQPSYFRKHLFSISGFVLLPLRSLCHLGRRCPFVI